MPDDAERKGIGTPSTRAAILEKLVSTGLVERKKAKKITNLLPTQAGSSSGGRGQHFLCQRGTAPPRREQAGMFSPARPP